MPETIEELKRKIALYEENGAAKLYYSLVRKMNEMADLFNKNTLSNIPLDDVKDKSFDRLFKLLEKSEVVSRAVSALGDIAGITGNEEKDIKINRNLTPENISDVLGNTTG